MYLFPLRKKPLFAFAGSQFHIAATEKEMLRIRANILHCSSPVSLRPPRQTMHANSVPEPSALERFIVYAHEAERQQQAFCSIEAELQGAR
ncbi:hypothetical protein CTRI78_v003937 [Colletotrichum trifolii]|uniref:Uncharacterized protein n=1 Tax=Colletotrichum trifolii TaxID=5466 RepID=A0A4R8RQK8_COLTR|nr:hypothetical protein CTRI78_v003937 [Colletotrichum trifolii]